MKTYAVHSNYINIKSLNRQFGFDETKKAMDVICERITNALKVLPDHENYRVRCLNLLERDSNPEGANVFFAITTYDPLARVSPDSPTVSLPLDLEVNEEPPLNESSEMDVVQLFVDPK